MSSQPPFKEELINVNRQGRQMPVYVASPENVGAAQLPGVIIIHEIFGLNDHIKAVARRFTVEGFVAFAPDLFANYPNAPADKNDLNAMRALWSEIPDATLIADLQEVMAIARGNEHVLKDRIGTIGFCMGGAIAYMFACSSPEVAWVADFYGRIYYPQLSEAKPKHPIDYTDTLKCPVLGNFAGIDDLIPPDQIEEFKNRITAKGQRADFKIYDGAKHAFFNDQREFYDSNAAADAWQRTITFSGARGRS